MSYLTNPRRPEHNAYAKDVDNEVNVPLQYWRKGKYFPPDQARGRVEQLQAFEKLKCALYAIPGLILPDMHSNFVIKTDVSNYCIGEVLPQD